MRMEKGVSFCLNYKIYYDFMIPTDLFQDWKNQVRHNYGYPNIPLHKTPNQIKCLIDN